MPVLHMETALVRSVQQAFVHLTGLVTTEQGTLARSSQQLAGQWQGSSADAFLQEMSGLLQALQRLEADGSALHTRLENEVLQWEMVASRLGAGVGSGTAVLPGGPSSVGEYGRLPDQRELHEAFYDGERGRDIPSTHFDPFGSPTRSVHVGNEGDDDRADFSAVFYERGTHESGSVIGSEYSGQYGTVRGDLLGYETGAEFQVGLDDDGLEVDMGAGAEAYVARVGYEEQVGFIGFDASAQVGAEVGAEAQIEFNPLEGDLEVEAEVGGFIGVSADAEAQAELGPAIIGVGGTIGAGLGAHAYGEIGFDDWVFRADGGAGAFIGIGGGVDFSVEIDIPELAEGIVDLGEMGVDALGRVDIVEIMPDIF